MRKRLLALCFAVIFLISTIPVYALDTQVTESLSVFIASDRHGSDTNLKSILNVISKSGYKNLTASVLDGDTFDGNSSGGGGKKSSSSQSSSYDLSSVTSVIQNIIGSNVRCYYTYGTHDGTDDSSKYFTGAIDLGEAYLYGITYSEMSTASTAKTASASFTSWVNSIDKSSKPIFIISHMPMHSRRGDNNGASYWISAINVAGEEHNIVFLWGHNHTGESTADTSAYYVEKGGSITAQGNNSATVLTFTYMNAGYLKNGYGSVLTVNSDKSITVKRYSTSALTATYEIEPFGDVAPKYQVKVQTRLISTDIDVSELSPTGGGSDINPEKGTPLTALASDKYRFIGWYSDYSKDGFGTLLSTDLNFSLYPQQDVTVTAVYCLIGDSNGDGTIAAEDLQKLRNYLANYNYSNNTCDVRISCGADINGDGNVTLADLIMLRTIMADLEN